MLECPVGGRTEGYGCGDLRLPLCLCSPFSVGEARACAQLPAYLLFATGLWMVRRGAGLRAVVGLGSGLGALNLDQVRTLLHQACLGPLVQDVD